MNNKITFISFNMCGISGIFSNNLPSNAYQRMEKMNESIKHRGPDSSGIYHNEKICLGFQRLAIIDLDDRSNQPMHSIDNNWHIVFNGEIYNFNEIKECLSYSFKTKSDTEVILASIFEKGIDWFLARANGMFSFAIFNSQSSELFLARDRMGIKPLYYTINESGLIFSSEIKGILSSGLVDANLNSEGLDEYLGNRYIRSPYTFFENIFQVKPGSYLHFSPKEPFKEKIYWSLPKNFNMEKKYNENEILEEFESKLIQSIKYRMISDVSLGTYLSGGVDSSLITAIASRIKKTETLNSYTIGFSDNNEFDFSQIVADAYETNHHKILMRKGDYLDSIEKLISFKDAPLGVPNEIPLAKMSSILKEKITVVLSGEGADELMGGYGKIYRSPFNNDLDHNKFYNYFISQYEYVSRDMRDNFLSTPKNYRKEFDNKLLKNFKNDEESIFRYFHNYHVQGLLQRVDITTMQTSVEARVPFLDHELIEFAYNKVPLELKLKWRSDASIEKAKKLKPSEYSEILDIPKYLLRKLSYKYLDKKIVDRSKVGFPVPLSDWFHDLKLIAQDTLHNASWLKNDSLDKLIEQSFKCNRSGQILWMFINIEIFRRLYFNKTWRW